MLPEEAVQHNKPMSPESVVKNPEALLQTLVRLQQTSKVLPFKFGQQLWFADGRHVLYWPAEQILIVADLHFGKGQSLNRYGNFIPTLDTTSTLRLLRQVLQDYQPKHLIALGDSFHDKYVGQGMSESDNAQLTELCKSVPVWTWILGNHDEDMPQIWPGNYQTHFEQQGIVFLHEPEPDVLLQIVGHFHPKYKARLKGTSVSGRCFVKDQQTLIMPSFGSYTGGLAIEDNAIQEVFKQAIDGIYLCHQQQIYSFAPRL